MMDEVAEVESATRIAQFFGQAVIKVDEKAFVEDKVFYADSNFFDFFSFHLLEGNPKTALKEPSSVVITSKMAKKYFSSGRALGKLLTVGNDNKTYKITCIAEPAPPNSHFHYEFLV